MLLPREFRRANDTFMMIGTWAIGSRVVPIMSVVRMMYCVGSERGEGFREDGSHEFEAVF